MTVLLGFVIFSFVGFWFQGGLLLRAGGMLLMIVAGWELLTQNHSEMAIFWFVFGLVLWLIGHWAYAFAYSEYKSVAAGYLLEELILPHFHLRGMLSAAAGTLSTMRIRTRTTITGLASRSLKRTAPANEHLQVTPKAIKIQVIEAGEAAADVLRPRIQATLEEVDGPN